jgi:1,4-alpha-glucan branching enzyme
MSTTAAALERIPIFHGDLADTGRIRLPAPEARTVEMRFAPLAARDRFDPRTWQRHALAPDEAAPGYFEIDLDTLALPDGAYEYEFVLDGRNDRPVPDPYAEELTRFGGYRGVFHMRDGRRFRPPFSWDDELPEGRRLANNHELVIYEMPLRWMESAPEDARQIGLGDFDHVIFAHLDRLAELGINAIELLPVQDSPDTLNWGYGTRFFFAPDIDMGSPVDMKFFVKSCHQRSIRVILDVVMNHARNCPLEALADDWYFLRSGAEEGGRPDWGGRIFRFRRPAPDGSHPAREFHYLVAEFWVREYHIDGFRIDEFKGIDHWEFVQTFRDRACVAHRTLFPARPFLVVAEDSWRRAATTQNRPDNPGGRKVVDSIWNFAFQDEARRLLRNRIHTAWGQPSRRERIRAMIGGWALWDDWDRRLKGGFTDLAQAVNYITSHDVEQHGEQRFLNYILADLLCQRGLAGDPGICHLDEKDPIRVRELMKRVRWLVNHLGEAGPEVRQAHREALDRAGSAFALLLTSVGIPMLLAGEEFGDVHDLDHTDWRLKMSDPIDWSRRDQPGHRALWHRVRELIRLRTSTPALQRNEIDFFYFHPSIDHDDGVRVFAYARTGGEPLGSRDQVAVVANAGPHHFPEFHLPWPWTNPDRVTEIGAAAEGDLPHFRPDRQQATVSLAPFQVRVFRT